MSLAQTARSRWKTLGRAAVILGLVLLVGLNALAFSHAWSITHYAPVDIRTTRLREIDTLGDRVSFLLRGPQVRRMGNVKTPATVHLPFEERAFTNARGQMVSAWRIPGQPGRPQVLMFPGYGASKDTLLGAAVEFHALGCETWLVDFSGIGDSEGTTTTIGWREAEDVAAAVQASQPERAGELVLYGGSMGAVAILAAQHRGLVKPDAVILECPFDSFTRTLGNRLSLVRIPRIPFAPMVAFWVGVQHGFNGLAHNPIEYARSVQCPVLLMQGENDTLVGRSAGLAFAKVFGERGTFQMMPNSGHAWLVRDATELWRTQVRSFLEQRGPRPVVKVSR